MLSPPAMQAGRYVAARDPARPDAAAFRYHDKGTMATIGRRAAVAQMGPIQLTGFLGWVAWLVVHLYYLIGFENRLRVMLRWGWYYVRLDRPVRAILRADPAASWGSRRTPESPVYGDGGPWPTDEQGISADDLALYGGP